MNDRCYNCAMWSEFDGCCWNPLSFRYLQLMNGNNYACGEFDPEQEEENENNT